MSKTTFLGYVPSLKSKHEATIVGHKAIQSKGGSIRYTLQGEYDGRKTLPKTVSKADFEGIYGFDAKAAESVIITGKKNDKREVIGHVVGETDKDGFTPQEIIPEDYNILTGRGGGLGHLLDNHKDADTVGSPSPASVEPPAPSESPFPQEPSNENFSAECEECGVGIENGKQVSGHYGENFCPPCSRAIAEANPQEPSNENFSAEDGWVKRENEHEIYLEHEDSGIEIQMNKNDNGIVRIIDEYGNEGNVGNYATIEEAKVAMNKYLNNEVKEAFGFGKKDEEEESEEPKTQEFTVVLQEGDKLELTDIEDGIPADDEPKEEDSPEESENEEKDAESNVRVFVVSSVDYDIDGREQQALELEDDGWLPQDFTFALDIDDVGDTRDMQEIADLIVDDISDETGFLVNGFYFQEKMPDGTLVDLNAESEEELWALGLDHRQGTRGIHTVGCNGNKNSYFQGGSGQNELIRNWREDSDTWTSKQIAQQLYTDLEESESLDESRTGNTLRELIKAQSGLIKLHNCCKKVNTDNLLSTTFIVDLDAESYEAVQAKVTRPVKEDETEDEEESEGLSTLAKVGLGVGALAAGVALFGAEEDDYIPYEAETDYTEIYGLAAEHESESDGFTYAYNKGHNDGINNEVIYRPSIATDKGRNIYRKILKQKAEDFQKMTPSEFVPFDQITAEIQEEWDETTPSISADYEPSNEPTNSNFSADTAGWALTHPKMGRSGVFTTKDDAEKVKNWHIRYAPPHYENETSMKIVNANANDGELDNHSKGILLGSETVGSPSPSGPSSVPEPAEATGSEPSNEQFSAVVDKEFYENVSGSLCPNCGRDGDLGHFSTLYWCDDCGNEGCDGCTDDCDCNSMEAESKNLKMALGITAVGIGLAAVLGKDKIKKLFDRLGL